MKGLTGKTFLVTGAASGIGRATAQRLANEGAYVAVLDRNSAGAEAAADDLIANGARAVAYGMDVTSRDDWSAVLAKAKKDFGAIGGLVNNAGLTRDRSLGKMADEDWDVVININLRGTWLGCQAIAPYLKEDGGAIVNLSSESRWGAFGQANYSAAKSGIIGLTRTVAFELARYNIRANSVAPGTTTTPMVEAVPKDIREGWLSGIPLGREASPDEIASVITFLLSNDASYITGQVIGVNGGSSI
jgi:3-oxoacyl-[acyl-carrier protein] reductase